MVSFAGSLPKGEANGLEHHARALVEGLAAGHKHFVVGVLRTHSVKTGDDLVPVPTAAFTRVELIGLGSDLEDAAARLLNDAHSERIGGPGQQRFDLPDSGVSDSAAAEPEVLELDAGGGMFFRVVDVEPGVFELRLCSQYVEGLLVRRLQRSEWGEVVPGDYQTGQFDAGLAGFAERLLLEWETNDGGSVVDAVVVDEGDVVVGDSE